MLDSMAPTIETPSTHSHPTPAMRGVPAATGADVTDPARIRVLIVDDHQVVRTGLKTFFDLLPDIEVVGEAADGSEGVAMARRLEPDVVLMDLLMPNMDGITAIGRIKAERPETEIVTMTSFIEEEKVTSALEAGASGYVLKDAEADEVATAVRAAFAGEVHLDPAVARLLAQRMRNRTLPAESLAEPLTEREEDVIRLLGQGMSNKEIGAALFVSETTIKYHLKNIYSKLGASDRTEAALVATQRGILTIR
jgi:NarL family two-component system response regulator LiaR